jgi:hypothetical protein
MPLEILNGTLMLLGSRPTPERAEIAASAGLWILLAGVKPVLA